jgi:hypothetical protein
MSLRLRSIGAIGTSLVLTLAASSITFAAPLYGHPIVSPEPVKATSPHTTGSNTAGTSPDNSVPSSADETPVSAPQSGGESSTTGSTAVTAASANVPEQLKPAQLPACKQHSNMINAIMVRADTRTNNQIVLIAGIAAKVEEFYVSTKKTVPTYSPMVAAINADQVQADNDLANLVENSTFSCSGNNPVGIVSTYRADLVIVENDMQTMRTDVQKLVTAVAQVEGYTLPSSSVGGTQ